MPTTETRIATLEKANPTADMGPMFIHFVGLDTKDSEIQRVTKGSQEWERLPGESEQELKDRAQNEAAPNPHGITVFLCYSDYKVSEA